jgi:hypothetical protein
MASLSDSVLDLQAVLLSRADARSFLQGQLKNDVRRLSPERGLLAAVTMRSSTRSKPSRDAICSRWSS